MRVSTTARLAALALGACVDVALQPDGGAARSAVGGADARGAAPGSPDTERGAGSEPDAAVDPAPFTAAQRTETFTYTTEAGQTRTLETVIWYPSVRGALATPEAPLPLVVFSHGCGGLPSQYAYLLEHLAARGFVVAAPIHPGNSLRDCAGCACGTDGLYARPGDLIAVRDALLGENDAAGSFWLGGLDPDRTAVAGHSNGAWATMATASGGGGFRAALALGLVNDHLVDPGLITVPVLIMHAVLDEPADLPQRVYAGLARPRFLADLRHASHYAFTGSDSARPPPGEIPLSDVHVIVNRLATAFLERYLVGDASYAAELTPGSDPEVSLLADP